MTENKRITAALINNRLESFFMGRAYPICIGVMVLLSYFFGLEPYIWTVNVLLVSAALAVCKSARPAIMFVISFVFQVSVKNSPGVPSFSYYYFTSWRLPLVIILSLTLLSAIVYFSVKNKIFSGFSLRSPLVLPLLIFAVAMSVGGIFSGKWQLSGAVYGLCNGICLALVFIFFYFGLRGENRRELVSYFIYVSALLTLILIAELAYCYAVNDIKFDITSGKIDVFEKEKMHFGWGISNTMGVSLIVLIPVLLLGFYEKIGRFFYVPLAFIVYFASYLSMSRNAMLFGTVTLILSIAVILFSSKRKKIYAIISIPLAVAAVTLAVIYKDAWLDTLKGFFTENGRFRLWEHGIDNFLKHPIFGVGFFGFELSTFEAAEFLPTMAHQTFVQLLSATGIVGLVSYLYYRVMSLVPIVRRPSAVKLLLTLSAGAMLFESLLDNFIFYFLPTLHYSIVFAVLFVVYTREREEIKNKPEECRGGNKPLDSQG